MILIKIEERHEFDEWSEHFTYYENFKVEDYDTKKITARTILEEFFGEDDERVQTSWVKSIKELSEFELKILKKFNIVY
tara:strand:+ start:1944 stop:2180 length:237 start_codon:yes stop_codon:yes gene_type:complete